MPKEKKEQIAGRIEEFLSGYKIAIVTDYRGMPVAEMSQLRRRLKESGIEYHVVKKVSDNSIILPFLNLDMVTALNLTA